jgi:hypothetical protein
LVRHCAGPALVSCRDGDEVLATRRTYCDRVRSFHADAWSVVSPRVDLPGNRYRRAHQSAHRNDETEDDRARPNGKKHASQRRPLL